MELSEALFKRRSVRKFTAEPVSEENVLELLHAGMSGPSACNKTPWEFFVITKPEVLEKLRKAARYSKIEAPLAIVVCGNLSKALPSQLSPFWIQDCSAATENILLRAVDLELGAVWCGIHPMKTAEKNVREALSLPEKFIPLNIIYIGHPSEEPEARDQFNEKKVHYIK
ncbi:MAG: nitroreductase family protein [Oscillospiraceae bacterium]|nr:nitroreductase family protein [Oscillospiraceae bacterium]